MCGEINIQSCCSLRIDPYFSIVTRSLNSHVNQKKKHDERKWVQVRSVQRKINPLNNIHFFLWWKNYHRRKTHAWSGHMRSKTWAHSWSMEIWKLKTVTRSLNDTECELLLLHICILKRQWKFIVQGEKKYENCHVFLLVCKIFRIIFIN